MSWRFYPLSEFPTHGILLKFGGVPGVAEYLTPKQAKALREAEKRGFARMTSPKKRNVA